MSVDDPAVSLIVSVNYVHTMFLHMLMLSFSAVSRVNVLKTVLTRLVSYLIVLY